MNNFYITLIYKNFGIFTNYVLKKVYKYGQNTIHVLNKLLNIDNII